jgi:hypothetical protein
LLDALLNPSTEIFSSERKTDNNVEDRKMQKSIFEQMGGTYTHVGDYLIPDLVISDTEQSPLRKYGRMRKRYLKEHRPVLYTNLLLSGELFQHSEESDKTCEERMELLTQQMAKQEGVTEALKDADQMEWVRRMNSIRNRAEEIVLRELIDSD